ncbi:MAG: hypothetical protein EXR98_20385 [Gemmataceae bacterium]|nr:hypothetical protein [Gemmataceae bacterium]
MPFLTTCPGCHSSVRLAETLAGRMVRCQKCSTMFVAPEPMAAPAEPELMVAEPMPLPSVNSTAPTDPGVQIFDAKAMKPPFIPMKIVEAKAAELPGLEPSDQAPVSQVR